jgi:hypothetical protein
VVDLGERGAIATGIGFLNHMIDQLTSHAQLGVSVCEVVSVRLSERRPSLFFGLQVQIWVDGNALSEHEDVAGGSKDVAHRPHDAVIVRQAGLALGRALVRAPDDPRSLPSCRGVLCTCPKHSLHAPLQAIFIDKQRERSGGSTARLRQRFQMAAHI